MHSMDFEEFLWAKGYKDSQIYDLYRHMPELKPFSELEMSVMQLPLSRSKSRQMTAALLH